jgi:hypothetical protein
MKVSLITYHDEDNYGAILQTYATYNALKKLNVDVEIIDYRMQHKQSLLSLLLFAIRRYRHQSFRNKYFDSRTRIYNSLDELRADPPISDCYIVGSDQTWNPEISKEHALAYFLDFGGDKVRRVSYAASIGLDQWKEDTNAPTEKVKRALAKFHSVLVREKQAVEICKSIFDIEAHQVVDPVLLFNDYSELIGNYNTEKGKMVIYKLINNQDFYNKSKIIADYFEMHRVSVGSIRKLKGIRCPYPESVENWVKQFATAELVFTDSFHGTILSLLYHKPFVVYVGDPKRVSRLTSILSEVGLLNRICTADDSVEHLIEVAKSPVDWSYVDKKINSIRLTSFDKLRAALFD